MRSRWLAAAVLLSLGLPGCGGAGSSAGSLAGSSAESSPSGSPPAAASSPGASKSAAARGLASPATGSSTGEGHLSGRGYTFALPQGWREATEQFQEYTELIDGGAVNAGQAGQPFIDNVNVLRNADQVELPPAQAEEQFADELRTVATRVEVRPPVHVDGVEALHLTGRTDAGEVTALTDQFIVHVDGAYFVVTFSFGDGTPRAQRKDAVDSMLDSWTWG
jgi:hypothetical protein